MNKLYEENHIQDIANAIRNKNVSGTFTVAEMANAVNNIQTGKVTDPVIGLTQVEAFEYPVGYVSIPSIGSTSSWGYHIIKSITPSLDNTLVLYARDKVVLMTTDIIENIVDVNNIKNVNLSSAYDHGSAEVFPQYQGPGIYDMNNIRILNGIPVINRVGDLHQVYFPNAENIHMIYAYWYWLTDNPLPIPPNVTDMAYAYFNCKNLIGPPQVGPNVIDMTSAYSNCWNLTGQPVVGPNVVNMFSAYRSCIRLTGSPVVGPNVINMSSAYMGCNNLIAEGFDYMNVDCIDQFDWTPGRFKIQNGSIIADNLNSSFYGMTNYSNLQGYISIGSNNYGFTSGFGAFGGLNDVGLSMIGLEGMYFGVNNRYHNINSNVRSFINGNTDVKNVRNNKRFNFVFSGVNMSILTNKFLAYGGSTNLTFSETHESTIDLNFSINGSSFKRRYNVLNSYLNTDENIGVYIVDPNFTVEV